MVREGEKARNECIDAVVLPTLRGFGHTHHGGPTRLCVARHPWKRVDHLDIVTEFTEEVDVILNKDASSGVPWNGVKQRDDEDLNGEASSVECLVNFSKVFGHTGSVVEQA